MIYKANPDAKLYIAQVLDENSNGSEKDVISGVKWAIKQDVDVINMSISSYKYSSALKTTIDTATNKGIIIVAPVGNNGPNGTISYPAKFDNVLAIGSVNSKLKHSKFSNTGPEIDFVVKGENIDVTSIYDLKEKNSGTSISAAQVTGMISNILKLNNKLTFNDVYSILKKSSISKKDKYLYGNGILKPENRLDGKGGVRNE